MVKMVNFMLSIQYHTKRKLLKRVPCTKGVLVLYSENNATQSDPARRSSGACSTVTGEGHGSARAGSTRWPATAQSLRLWITTPAPRPGLPSTARGPAYQARALRSLSPDPP